MAKTKVPKECPLWLHKGTGQWAKKVRGRMLYFGKDLDAALKRWADEKDALLAGRPVPLRNGKATLTELANLYIDSCRKRVASGDIGQHTVDGYTATLKRLIAIRGGSDCPEYWAPLDFQAIKQRLSEPVERMPNKNGLLGRQVERRSSVTVDLDIRVIRAFLKWCTSMELIPPPRYGQEFQQTPKKVLRKMKAAAGRRDISAEDLRAILDKCSVHLKPIVLLGINGGIGAKDIAHIRMDQLDGKSEWLDLPRMKTGTQRRIWLWPETRQAVKEYLARRIGPTDLKSKDMLFVTKYRSMWMRGTEDAIGKAFIRLRNLANVQKCTFYDLRRTFQTIGDQTRDYPTVKFIMGHVAPADDMSAHYRQHVDDDAIRAVCSHVRNWLFG